MRRDNGLMRGAHLQRVRLPLRVRLQLLGVEALGPEEESRMVRLRGPEHMFRVLEGLSPKERGEAMLAGLKATHFWFDPPEE